MIRTRQGWAGILRFVPAIAAGLLVAGMFTEPAWSTDQSGPLKQTSIKLIEAAQLRGEIDFEQALVLKVRSVTRPDELPEVYRSQTALDGKCAAQVMIEAVRNVDRLSPSNRAVIAADIIRPAKANSYDSPAGYFRIHYDVTGSDAVPTTDANTNGIPDYIENVAVWADSCWSREVITYGYMSPPSDDTVGGGIGIYDIYCREIPYYGYTVPESPGPNAWNDRTSYIAIHRDFYGFPPNTDPEGNPAGAAKVTLAHEFYHAVQFAYDYAENGSWMEEGATWMEDEVYDVVNDNYNYLSDFFPVPQVALMSDAGLHPYAAFVWPRFLGERFGVDVNRAIWDSCISLNVYGATDSVLTGLGSSRSDAFAEFTTWNWITNTRDDGLHYEEAGYYPLISTMRSHNSYPVATDSSSQVPQPLAANYIYFTPPLGSSGRPLVISFDGDDSFPWRANVMARDSSGNYDVFPVPLDANGAGSVLVPDFGGDAHAVLVPANVSINSSGNFTYSACIGPLPPNPTLPDNGLTASSPVVLEWEYDPTSVSYHVQVDDDPAFGSPEIDSSVTTWTYTTEGLGEGVLYYWRVAMVDDCGESAWSDTWSFTNNCVIAMTGDVNVDLVLTSADIIYMVNYIFKSGPAPLPIHQAGDVNCDGVESSADVIYLVTHVFKGGLPPCDVCSIL